MLKQRGVTIIEALLVLTIAASIITAAVAYFSMTHRQMKVQHAISQIKTITAASYEWLHAQRQPNFSDINGGTEVSIQKLIDEGFLQSNNPNDATTYLDPWGGSITVSADPTNPKYVSITLDHIPKAACYNLSHQLTSINKAMLLPKCNATHNEYTGAF